MRRGGIQKVLRGLRGNVDKEHYLTEMNPVKAILYLSIPMMIGNLFQQGYNAADAWIAGSYISGQALAAVGACYAVSCVFLGLAAGGGIGTAVIAAGYWGAGKTARFRKISLLAVTTFLGLSILLGAGGFFLTRRILLVLNTPEDILEMSVRYLHIFFLGLPFLFLYNISNSLYNALGKSAVTLWFLILSSVINLGLDYLFVAVWSWGISGAAWATVLAQAMASLLSLGTLFRYLKRFEKKGKMERMEAGDFSELIRASVPSMLQQSLMFLGMLLVQTAVNRFGAEALAGYSFAMRMEAISLVPLVALGNALSPFTAQNRGANRRDRVVQGLRQTGWLTLVLAAVIGLAVHLGAPWLARGFLGKAYSQTAFETGCGYLRFVSLFFWLNGLKALTDGFLRGNNDMAVFTAANTLNLAVRVFCAYYFAGTVGIAAVWYAVPVGWMINFLMSILEVRSGRWMRKWKSDPAVE